MQNIYWDLLKKNQEEFKKRRIENLFKADNNRFIKCSIKIEDFYFDYSKTNIDSSTLTNLIKFAETSEIMKKVDAMFKGDKINITENRSVLHTALRNFKNNNLNSISVINKKLQRRFKFISTFCNQIRNGKKKSCSGDQFTDVVNIGIGGSELGPKLVTSALSEYHDGPKIHFVSNIDSSDIIKIIKNLDPNKTLFILSSKSFTTIETISNAKAAIKWVCSKLGSEGMQNFIAVCSSKEKALDLGIFEENVFEFDEWVGGRFSVWGPIGLPIMLAIGVDLFTQFLEGAAQIDYHFKNEEVSKNLPITLALIGFWHSTICQYTSRAILPYETKLEYLPTYLQQLDMESNGKSVNLNGDRIDYPTTPVIWGQVGTNSQHAFFQFLHQSNQIIPCEFLLGANCIDDGYYEKHHLQLIVNCLAQSEALMLGIKNESRFEEKGNQHHYCVGNRPSTVLIYKQLTPRILGKLLALFEHRTFSEGILWNINSFDQWGVEIGKKIAKKLTENLNQINQNEDFSNSTLNLLNEIKKLKNF
ncbi:MAG: glucose-6-phosphate isomerase [Paracoccaceae bacterium]